MEENVKSSRPNGRPSRTAGLRKSGVRTYGNAGRSPGSRRLASRPGGIPRLAYIAVAVPAAGIVVILVLTALLRGRSSEETRETVDPNREIAELERQVETLRKSYQETVMLLQKEDPSARTKADKLRVDLQNWLDRWEAVFRDKCDAEGRLLPEYRGYGEIRRRVNEVLSDFNRVSPF